MRQMKRYVVFLCLVGLVAVALAQQTGYRKMTSFVRQAAMEGRRLMPTRSAEPDNQRSIMAFVRVNETDADAVLNRHGCRKYAQWGDLVIASIPLTRLERLSAEPSVSRIEASRGCHVLVDTVATAVNVLPLYEPSEAHPAFTGEGVVYGIVDAGFDLGHPTFFDTTAERYRIGAFWDQLSKDTVGSILPVGRDFVGYEAVLQQERSTDSPSLTHGTHTLGIAAGSGYDTSYRGMAFNSDLCVVGNLVGASNIEYVDSADYYKYSTAVDALGFKYCFDYAGQQGKPCVVSLSEGYAPYLDEEDSLYAAALDHLIGPGRIILASAGNESVEKSYFEKPVSQPTAGAFVRCFSTSAYYKVKTDDAVRLLLYYYATDSGQPTDTLTFETADVPVDTTLYRRLLLEGDTLTFSACRDKSRFSEHDIWLLQLIGNRRLDKMSPIALVVEGQGRVEVYGNSTNAFKTSSADNRWSAAEDGHNIFAPGCFPSVICVGAMTHQGNELAYYSSKGPGMNDLMKPEVVAPGSNVTASYSRFYQPENQVVGYSTFHGEEFPWGRATGTSMSTPVVGGIIALWLQAKPDLTPDEVRAVLSRTCSHPDPELSYPNNAYGYGGIDAYRGLLDVLGLSGISAISHHQPRGVEMVPDADGLRLLFSQPPSTYIYIKVYSLSGACLYAEHVMANSPEVHLTLPASVSGVCAVQIDAPSLSGSRLVRIGN